MLSKKMYTKKLGSEVAALAKVSVAGKYHVILGDNNTWMVVANGNLRATRVFSSRTEAIEFAKKSASKKSGEVVIHKRSGDVEDRISFQNVA